MNYRIKKISAMLLAFVIGILIGAAGTALWAARSLQLSLETAALGYLAYENEEATKQYFYSSDIDLGIYALQHLITFMENVHEDHVDKSKMPQTFFHDLVVAYVRLGRLYETKGDREKAVQNYRKGLEIVFSKNLYEKWKGTQKEIKNIDDLKRFIAELDARLTKKE